MGRARRSSRLSPEILTTMSSILNGHGMTEKKPVGVLGWINAELAQHARTGEWPRRVAEEFAAPGFSLNGLAKAALPAPTPKY